MIAELLRYGNWSGPNWSNGVNYGGRVLTDAELRTPGIDPYDNYVAKAHDLNEIFAAQRLREAMIAASPKHHDLSLRRANGDYAEPLIFIPVPGLSSAPRFADMHHYLTITPQHGRKKVAEAFYSYFNHVMRSGLQFAVDYVHNEVNLRNPRSILMNLQLFGGSHFFLTESNWAETQMNNLVRMGSVPPAYSSGEFARLEANFVSPTTGNSASQYISSVGRNYVRKVQLQTLLNADRRSLLLHATAVRDAKNRVD